jgi:hypothetical protein
MINKPTTVEIFLPDGDPKNIRTAAIPNRIIKATYIPRSKINSIRIKENLNSPGIYLLITISEDSAKPEIYIGETENIARRLNHHNNTMDFWKDAIAFTSETDFFTKTHVKYLEWLFYQTIKKANRCTLHNSEKSKPQKPHLSESTEISLIDVFETISILVSTLGLNIFQEAAPKKKDDLIFECKNARECNGKGQYTEEGFVVFKGAKCSKEISKRFQETSPPSIRNTLIQDKLLLEKNGFYELQEDFVFSSSSTAAQIILGAPANGWKSWKLSDGKTLDEVYRQK